MGAVARRPAHTAYGGRVAAVPHVTAPHSAESRERAGDGGKHAELVQQATRLQPEAHGGWTDGRTDGQSQERVEGMAGSMRNWCSRPRAYNQRYMEDGRTDGRTEPGEGGGDGGKHAELVQ